MSKKRYLSNQYKTRERKDYIFNEKANKKRVFCTIDEIVLSALTVCNGDKKAALEFLIKHGGQDNEIVKRAKEVFGE